MKDSANYENEI